MIKSLIKTAAYALMGANAGIQVSGSPVGGALAGIAHSFSKDTSYAGSIAGGAAIAATDVALGIGSVNFQPTVKYIGEHLRPVEVMVGDFFRNLHIIATTTWGLPSLAKEQNYEASGAMNIVRPSVSPVTSERPKGIGRIIRR